MMHWWWHFMTNNNFKGNDALVLTFHFVTNNICNGNDTLVLTFHFETNICNGNDTLVLTFHFMTNFCNGNDALVLTFHFVTNNICNGNDTLVLTFHFLTNYICNGNGAKVVKCYDKQHTTKVMHSWPMRNILIIYCSSYPTTGKLCEIYILCIICYSSFPKWIDFNPRWFTSLEVIICYSYCWTDINVKVVYDPNMLLCKDYHMLLSVYTPH